MKSLLRPTKKTSIQHQNSGAHELLLFKCHLMAHGLRSCTREKQTTSSQPVEIRIKFPKFKRHYKSATPSQLQTFQIQLLWRYLIQNTYVVADSIADGMGFTEVEELLQKVALERLSCICSFVCLRKGFFTIESIILDQATWYLEGVLLRHPEFDV